MTAQKGAPPLTVLGQFGRSGKDVYNRLTVAARQGHKETWHEREVEVHMHFVAIAKVFNHFFWPHIRF